MEQPLRRTYEAMPDPRVVIAAGTDACSGSIWTEPEVLGGVDRVLPVDVYVPGDPPSPIALLHGLLLAAGRVREASPLRGPWRTGGAAAERARDLDDRRLRRSRRRGPRGLARRSGVATRRRRSASQVRSRSPPGIRRRVRRATRLAAVPVVRARAGWRARRPARRPVPDPHRGSVGSVVPGRGTEGPGRRACCARCSCCASSG